jgi:hypothetical protein
VGAAARALTGAAVAVLVTCAARTAVADDGCWMSHRGESFPVCFDPGNRLRLDVTGDADGSGVGFGGAIQLRHTVLVDDPDVSWRFEHRMADVRIAGRSLRATAYAGRTVRHSSDGHVVLPFGRPRKLFLPFDIGAEAEVGTVRGQTSGGDLRVNAVRTVALVELSRADHFRRRLAIGAAARWDLQVDSASRSAREHAVAPFSLAAVDLRAESRSGLTSAGVRAEAGGVWSTAGGWRRWLGAEAEIERVFISVQDRPLSIFLAGELVPDDESLSGLIGLRVAPVIRIPRAQDR